MPVIHCATGTFALLYGRVGYGGAGTLLRAFTPDFIPLPVVFQVIDVHYASVEGGLAGFVTHMQGPDVSVFPVGLTYPTHHC